MFSKEIKHAGGLEKLLVQFSSFSRRQKCTLFS